jgi:hypothetical protein
MDRKRPSRLKRLLPLCEITMIDKGRMVSYGACGLPYYVEGMFPAVWRCSPKPQWESPVIPHSLRR